MCINGAKHPNCFSLQAGARPNFVGEYREGEGGGWLMGDNVGSLQVLESNIAMDTCQYRSLDLCIDYCNIAVFVVVHIRVHTAVLISDVLHLLRI